MADYLLDTNILSYWYDESRSEHAKVKARVGTAKQPDAGTGYVPCLFVSVVTLGEMEYGHRVNDQEDLAKRARYLDFVREQCPEVLELTKHVAEHYGRLRAWLFNNCAPRSKRTKGLRAEELVNLATGRELGIDENDLWIAAQALTYNLVLVTHDSRGYFGRVLQQFDTELEVEDWAR